MKALIMLALMILSMQVFADFERPYLVSSNVPHQVTILEHGSDALAERLTLIEKARHSINVEYFIYNTDQAGRLLTQALIKKAQSGVKVRMLLDYFSTKGQITPHIAKLLTEAGIEVKFYNTAPLLRIRKYMVRNHRKLLQIDGGEAILGGRNIADEYFDMNTEFSFIDRDVLVNGPITQSINESFEKYWNHDFSERADITPNEIINRKFEKKRKEALSFVTETEQDKISLKNLKEQSALWKENRAVGTCNKITFGTSMPGMGKESKSGQHLGNYLLNLIKEAPHKGKAESRVLLDSAYFIVDPLIRDALNSVVKDGAKVDIITNSIHSHDVVVMTPATNMSIRRLSKKDITFWYFQGVKPEGYNIAENFKPKKWASHVKSMIINDDTFMVGSYNFDPRAHHINGELAIVCEDSPELTNQLGGYFEDEIGVSKDVTSVKEYRQQRFNNVSTGGKIKYFLAWPIGQMIRPLL